MAKAVEFGAADYVVYPTHGVGRVLGVEKQEISGHLLELIIIKFEKDRMTLRVPVGKAQASGLRKLSSRKMMDTALATLKGRSRVKRTMWSRRAQEYEAKINSGDPVSIAEVVRDLHRMRSPEACAFPNITRKGEAPADAETYKGMEGKYEKFFSREPGKSGG